jgi:hypothetical protein
MRRQPMTRVDKSPEQLDAEASAPQLPLAPRIALHRLLAHAEVSIARLHQRDGEFGIGVPFSHPFERFLDESFGTFYWSAGLKALRQECRRRHSDHWHRPEWRGSLCYALVSAVCRFDVAYTRACFDLWVDPVRTEPTLHRALHRIEQKIDELQARASEKVHSDSGRHDWLAPEHEHHALEGLHQEDCMQCRRNAA